MTDSTTSARQTRTMLVSFLGAVVRPLGGWLPIGGTVELLGQVGLDTAAVRTSVSRLKQRGWLATEARAGARGYCLTGTARALLDEGDAVIWHAPTPAPLADGWCIVNFSVPESARAQRHQLRARLTALGFGRIGSAVWFAPARLRPAAQRLIADLDLAQQSAVFVGHYASGPELSALVRQSWDLDAIDARYRSFLDVHASALRAPVARDGRRSFAAYLTAVDDWRPLPFRDPGLPVELLGRHWAAQRAGALFERIDQTLGPPALDYARQFWGFADGPADGSAQGPADGSGRGPRPAAQTG